MSAATTTSLSSVSHLQGVPAASVKPVPTRSVTDSRLYGFAETLAYLGLLNLLVIAGVVAGAVVLGVAPSFAAAIHCSRSRLLGNEKGTVVRFWRTWAAQFGRANVLQIPAAAAMLMMTASLALLWDSGVTLLTSSLVVGLIAVTAYQVIVFTMDANYVLRMRDCWLLASRFMLRAPGAPLLLAATVALVGTICFMLPGLIPVFGFGTTVHLCTALCLSFYAANDRKITA